MIYRVLMDGNDILNYQEKPYILVNPSLTMELNTAGSFEFTMPPVHALYDAVKPLASTVAVYEDETLLWFGRPVEIRTDFFKQKIVYCEGALAFFNDSVQRFREYDRISLHTFFRTVIENHNAQVGQNRQFAVGTITVPDKTVYRKLNYDSTFDVLKRQCLNAEGGYLFLRQENGVSYIDWYAEMPFSSNQPVEFGLNMLDLSRVFDGSGIATCVVPLGDTDAETNAPLTVASVNNGSDVIESEAVADYGYITKSVTFPGVSHADTLYEDGLEYLASSQFDNLTIECSAAELHWQNENYGLFRLGQKIRCRSVPHLLDRTFDLQKISLRLDTAEKQITLGTVKRQSLTEITKETLDSIGTQITEAVTEQITGVYDTIESIETSVEEIGTAVEEITDVPEVGDYQTELEELIGQILEGEDLPEELEEQLEEILAELGGVEDYDDITQIGDELGDVLQEYEGYFDPEDYDSYSSQAEETSSGASSSSGSSSLKDIKKRVSKLEKKLTGIEKIINTLSAQMAAENWTHQIDGQAVTSGTVNFVTNV